MIIYLQKIRNWFLLFVLLFIVVSLVLLGVHEFRKHKSPHRDIQESYYTQTLDHFNINNPKITFQQRYFIDRTHWLGGDDYNPIFVVLGANGPITDYVSNVAVLNECVPTLGALIIYIEHRFYGYSMPYGRSIDDLITDPVVRNYLTTKQALADYEEIIINLKANLSAMHSPVVLVGGFYGGILATWMMMMNPSIAIGALASSAPVYYFYDDEQDGADDFCTIVSKDFEEINSECHNIISQSWTAIDILASQPGGLNNLSNTFKTCSLLKSSYELKSYLAHIYAVAAEYDQSDHLIQEICDGMTSAMDRDIISRIADAILALVAIDICHNISDATRGLPFVMDTQTILAWNWQICSEFVIPTGCNNNNSMLPVELFDISQHRANCEQQYGTSPPLNWIGHQIGGNSEAVARNPTYAAVLYKYLWSQTCSTKYI